MNTVIGNFVINPSTGRPIKVGSSIYNKLVREGAVKGEVVKREYPKGKNIVREFDSHAKAKEYKEKLQREEPPPEGKRYAISNNRKQVVMKNKKRNHAGTQKLLAEATLIAEQKLKKNGYGAGKSPEEIDEEDIEMFKNMVLQELANLRPSPQSSKKSEKKKFDTKKLLSNNKTYRHHAESTVAQESSESSEDDTGSECSESD